MAAPARGTFRKGDRVFGAKQGAYATRVAVKEDVLHRIPDGWSFEEAAGLYVTGIPLPALRLSDRTELTMATVPTSYAALLIRAKLLPGETVLVHAGAGGVGLAAIQIAKAAGATVIATASTPAKLAVCVAYGADHVLDYSSGDWPGRVLGLTGGKGIDVVYDPVGLIEASLKCIAWNGRLVVVGFAGGKIEKVAMNRVLLKNVAVVGLHWGKYTEKEKKEGTVEKVWAGVMSLVQEGKFKPTVFKGEGGMEFVGLESVGRALESLGKRETWGKVVVSIPREMGSRL